MKSRRREIFLQLAVLMTAAMGYTLHVLYDISIWKAAPHELQRDGQYAGNYVLL